MTARSHWRGNPIYYDEAEGWLYASDDTPVRDEDRPCGYCGKERTPEGHDPCLGTLPGVLNACCGHGNPAEAYVQFESGVTVRGFDKVVRNAGGNSQ